MKELLINEKNKEQFYESLLTSLSCDPLEIDIKVNKELLETYINNVLIKEYKIDKDLLNPLIVKISKFKTLYDTYLEDILKIKHNEYFIKIKLLIKELNNKEIKKYAIKNIKYLDLSNEVENEISNICLNLILKDNLKTNKEQIWFINYIIKKEALKYNINPDIKILNIPNISSYKIVSKNTFKLYKELPNNKGIINLRNYIATKQIDKDKAFKLLMDNCFFYLQDIIFNNINISNNYSKETYTLLKEIIAYNNNMPNSISNPLYKIIDSNIKEDKNDNIELLAFIDELVLNNPSILNDYPLLKLEYSDNGYKKTLRELISTKEEKIKDYKKQINELEKILKDSDNEIVINKITSDLNELKKNLQNIESFHNDIIYNSLKLLSILDLAKLLPKMIDNEIDCLKEAAIAEKNIIIKKLETNRKKIFKTATFLKNEEILTKEYSKAAGYESKINDYTKKQDN